MENLRELIRDIDKHMRAEWYAGRLPAESWPKSLSDRLAAAVAEKPWPMYEGSAGAIRAVDPDDLKAAPAAVAVPDGWKLVPELPTQDMCESAKYGIDARLSVFKWADGYKAMLSSAPEFAALAATPAADAPLPLLVRDIARELGITCVEACLALKPLGNFSTNTAVTAGMMAKLRECFPERVPASEVAGARERMTAGRACYFMERFLKEEKLLGPNEQAALHYVIDMLEAAAAPVVLPEPEPVPTPCRSMFATQREYADAMAQHRKNWAEIEAERGMLATGGQAQAVEQAPVLYVSKGQLDKHRDPDGPDSANAGRYLPARITPAGNFTMPLFAAPQAQAVDIAELVTGMSVSVDVSTGDDDAGNRYFGTVTVAQEDPHDKHGLTLLVQDAKPNFTPQVQEDARDAIRELIAKHSEELEHNAYAYFELAYTRRTGWMAWITDKPLNGGPVINPDRTVLCKGQGDTPEEACSAAIAAAKGSA